MNQPNKNKWLDTMLSEHLERKPAEFDREKWAEAVSQKPSTRSPKQTIPLVWRKIMKSPFTPAAAAMIAVVVCLSFLFPSPNGVALGEVLEAVEAQKSLVMTGYGTFTFDRKPKFMPPGHEAMVERVLKDEGGGRWSGTMRSDIYISPQGYANLAYTTDGEPVLHAALDQASGAVTVLFPTAKVYVRFTASQAIQDAIGQFTVARFIKEIFQSESHERAGTKDIAGIEAQGFAASDLHDRLLGNLNATIMAFIINMQEAVVTAWVDPETHLPVQIEGEGSLDPCVLNLFEAADMRAVFDNFTWGSDIDAGIFLPDIPSDYQQLDPLNPVKQAAWVGVLPCGLVGYGMWSRRKRRQMTTNKVD